MLQFRPSSLHLLCESNGSNFTVEALQAGSTGQLSIITAFANLAGCLARIFTSLQEEAGMAMVRGYLLGEQPAV